MRFIGRDGGDGTAKTASTKSDIYDCLVLSATKSFMYFYAAPPSHQVLATPLVGVTRM